MDATSELARERAVLVDSHRDLEQGERRIATQEDLLCALRAGGHDTRQAERLLDLLRDTLMQWQRHHGLILARIAYLAGGLEGPIVPPASSRPDIA